MELDYLEYDFGAHEKKLRKMFINPSEIIFITSDNDVRLTDGSSILVVEESAEKVRAYMRDVSMLRPF